MKISKIYTLLVLVLILGIAGSGCTSSGGELTNDSEESAANEETTTPEDVPLLNIAPNPVTHWNPESKLPVIDESAYIHPQATVIGDATIGARVMVSPHACVRGDEGMPLFIGDKSNIQEGVIVHGLETVDEEGETIEAHLVEVNGKKYSVYVGERVSLAHQAQVHGPAYVGNDTFIGMQALVFKATVGNNCVLEPASGAVGVTIPDGRYIPAGVVVSSQEEADKLPEITDDYGYLHTNEAVVYVNTNLADGYNAM